MDMIALGLGWYAAFLLSVTLHEAAHAWTALRLGDTTAYRGGQVTLDPLPHIQREPWGMVLVPIISYILGGWMIGWGSAPYDPQWALNYPRRSAWMALAGPAANLFLVLMTGIIIRVAMAMGWVIPASADTITFTYLIEAPEIPWLGGIATFVSILFSLNLILCFFNLLPMPPLDGSGALVLFLRPHTARRFMETLWSPNVYIFGLLIAWNIFSALIGPLYITALDLLFFGINRV